MPSAWLARVRESMETLTPEFSASRAIREDTENCFLPAAFGLNARADDDGKLGADLLQWRKSLAHGWKSLRFGKITVETKDGQHRFEIGVVAGALLPDQFQVHLYAGRAAEGDAEICPTET